MELKLSEIAKKISARLVGQDLTITGLSTIDNPKPGTLSFIVSKKFRKKLTDCCCAAVIVPPGIESNQHSLLVKDDPYLGFGLAMRLFHNAHQRPQPTIEQSAVISDTARIGNGVYIGHNVIIKDNVKMGNNCVIHPGVFIGEDSVIGDDCYAYANSVIMHGVTIGNRVAIYAGAVIGSDGFGYAKKENKFVKIPQVGTVVIEDDVEIGAGTTIDRATIGETRIGTGSIIDNLVQIAHNCKIGSGCIICAQVGLAGTTILGNNVILAGQVGVAGHLTIGDGTIVEAQSGVPKNLPAGSVVFGYPARDAKLSRRIEAIINHLPDYVQRLRNLERKTSDLEKEKSSEQKRN